MSHDWLIDLDEFAVDLPDILEGVTGVKRLFRSGGLLSPGILIPLFSDYDVKGRIITRFLVSD
jgi:hypothetical protein